MNIPAKGQEESVRKALNRSAIIRSMGPQVVARGEFVHGMHHRG